MQNRNGLLVDMCVTVATGHAEREAALQMVDAQQLRDATLGLTAATTLRTSSTVAAVVASLRMSPTTPATVAGPSTAGRRGGLATPSAV